MRFLVHPYFRLTVQARGLTGNTHSPARSPATAAAPVVEADFSDVLRAASASQRRRSGADFRASPEAPVVAVAAPAAPHGPVDEEVAAVPLRRKGGSPTRNITPSDVFVAAAAPVTVPSVQPANEPRKDENSGEVRSCISCYRFFRL